MNSSFMIIIGVLSIISLLGLFLIGIYLKKSARIPSQNLGINSSPKGKKFQTMLILPMILTIMPLVGIFVIPNYAGMLVGASIVLFLAIWSCMLPVQQIIRATKNERHIYIDQKNAQDIMINSLQRFSPTQLLTILKKEKLSDIHEGDNINRKLSILALDPFSILESSGPLNATERFRTMNDYINFYSALFSNKHSILYNFSGNHAVAFFNSDSMNPIETAIAIHKRTHSNLKLAKEDPTAARTLSIRPQYCAIVQGFVTIGFVFYNNMLQPLASSSAISIALQLQQVAQRLRIPILVSQDFIDKSMTKEHYNIRTVGLLHKPEDGQIVRTYEILDAYPSYRLEKLMETREIFEEACEAREKGEMKVAYSKFSYVLVNDPKDSLAQYFLDHARRRFPALPTDG